MSHFMFAGPVCAIALVSSAVAPPASARPVKQDWSKTVAATPSGGLLVGNPDAPNRLVEYISYTCSHCAHFVGESAIPLKTGFIANGSTSVEIQPYLRNPFDYAISLAVSCGTPPQAYGNHVAILATQPEWFAKLQAATPQRQQQYYASDAVSGMTMMILDSGLQPLLAARGIGAEQLTACLADSAKLQAIIASTDHASRVTGIDGTPSFTLNGQLLHQTFDWAGLRTALITATAARP